MHKKVSFLFIAICFWLFISCGCGNKADVVKGEQHKAGTSTVSLNKANPTLTEQMKTPTPNNGSNSIDKTEALEKTIKDKPSLFEQLKAAFHELDKLNSLNTEIEGAEFSGFTFNMLKDFLSTEQAFNLSESEYNSLSSGIKIFNVKSGRIFTFGGSSALFGDSGRTDYAYLQTKVGHDIKLSTLYYDVPKGISNVVQPFEDKNLIIITGSDRHQQGWRAFVDGFHIENGIANKIEVLKDYDDGLWCVDSTNGTVFLSNSYVAGTNINEKPGDIIQVEAGHSKLILSYNSKLQRYVVEKASK
jgi:hypothetical protein